MIDQVKLAFNKADNGQIHVFAIVVANANVNDPVVVYNSNDPNSYWEGTVTEILAVGPPMTVLAAVKRGSPPAGMPPTPLFGLRLAITVLMDAMPQEIDLAEVSVYDTP
jgi:hypothetical protein